MVERLGFYRRTCVSAFINGLVHTLGIEIVLSLRCRLAWGEGLFGKIGGGGGEVPYFGVLKVRSLLFRVLC